MPFSACSAADAGKLSGESRRHNPAREALEMQRVLHADVLNDETPPAVKAQCARAWQVLEAMKRVIKGKPAHTSQSIRSEQPKRTKAQSQPVLEQLPEEPTVKPAIKPSIEPK